MEPETNLEMPEGSDLREQARVYSTVKAVLMFQDGANRRTPDDQEHMRVINLVLANRDRERIVCSLVMRGITTYDDLVASLEVADAHHATVRDGIL